MMADLARSWEVMLEPSKQSGVEATGSPGERKHKFYPLAALTPLA